MVGIRKFSIFSDFPLLTPFPLKFMKKLLWHIYLMDLCVHNFIPLRQTNILKYEHVSGLKELAKYRNYFDKF